MSERREIQIVIEHLTKGLDRVQKSLDKQKELGKNTSALQAEFDALEDQLESLSLQDQLVRDLEAAESRLESSRGAARDFGQQIDALSGAVEDGAKRQREASDAYQQAKERVESLDVQIKRHAVNIAELRAEKERVKAESKAAAAQYGKESAEVQELTERDRQLADAIKDEQTERARSNVAKVEARQAAADLKRALADENRALNDVERDLNKASKAHNTAADRAERQAAEVSDLRAELRASGIDTSKLEAEQERLADQFKATQARAQEFGESVDRSTEALARSRSLGAKTLTSIAALGTALGNLATDALRNAWQGTKQLLGGFFDLGAQTEVYRKQLEGLEGSLDAANAVMERLRQLSDDTGTQFEANLETYTNLKNFGLDPLNGAMQAIIDQSAKLGGSQQTQERIVLALGQAYAKQRLQGEEILQLVEAGVPVYDLLSKAIGKNASELSKLASQGKLGRDEIDALIRTMGEAASGSAAARLNTARGLVEQLRKAFTEFLRDISDGGAFDAVRDQLGRLVTVLKENREQVQALARSISEFIAGAVNGLARFAEFVARNAGAIKTLTAAVATFIGLRFTAAVASWTLGLKSLAAQSVATFASVGGLRTALASLPSVVKFNVALLGFTAAYTAFSKLRERAKETIDVLATEEERLAKKYQAEVDANTQHIAKAYAERIAEHQKYAKASTTTYAEISNAAGQELASLEELLKGGIRLKEMELERAKLVGGATAEISAALSEQRAKLELLRERQDELGRGTARYTSQAVEASSKSRDLADALTGISGAAEDADKKLKKLSDEDLARGIEHLTAELAGAEAELKGVSAELDNFSGTDGDAFRRIGDSAEAARQRVNDLSGDLERLRTEQLDRLDADMARLGITSERSLQMAAARARDLYSRVAEANYPIRDQEAAWLAVARAELEAAAAAGQAQLRQVSAALKAESKTTEQREAVDALAQSYADAGIAAESFGDKSVSNLQRATRAAQDAAQALSDVSGQSGGGVRGAGSSGLYEGAKPSMRDGGGQATAAFSNDISGMSQSELQRYVDSVAFNADASRVNGDGLPSAWFSDQYRYEFSRAASQMVQLAADEVERALASEDLSQEELVNLRNQLQQAGSDPLRKGGTLDGSAIDRRSHLQSEISRRLIEAGRVRPGAATLPPAPSAPARTITIDFTRRDGATGSFQAIDSDGTEAFLRELEASGGVAL